MAYYNAAMQHAWFEIVGESDKAPERVPSGGVDDVISRTIVETVQTCGFRAGERQRGHDYGMNKVGSVTLIPSG